MSFIYSKNRQYKVDITSLIKDCQIFNSQFECNELRSLKDYIQSISTNHCDVILILNFLKLESKVIEVGTEYINNLTSGISIPRRLINIMINIPELRILLVLKHRLDNNKLPPIERRVKIPDEILRRYSTRIKNKVYLLRIGCDVRQVCGLIAGDIIKIITMRYKLDPEVILDMVSIMNELKSRLKIVTMDYNFIESAIKGMNGLIPAARLDTVIPLSDLAGSYAMHEYNLSDDQESINYILNKY